MDTNRHALLQAIRLLETAKRGLNRKTHPCDHCGVVVKERLFEHQAGDTLNGAVVKLRRLLQHEHLQDWLERPSN